MSRLIDADELRLTIQREYNTDDSDYPTRYQFGLHFAMDAIDEAPTVEPQRIKGRWIDVTKTGGAELWKCSECGELELEDSYFCPNCGADMRGEQDGKNS